MIAAMTRNARIGEFRSNIHRGGVGAQLELTEEYREIAVKAAKATKLEIAGVDMLVSHTGPKVIEVNSSPGLEGISAKHKDQVFIANSVDDFVESISQCKNRYDSLRLIGENARNFVMENFENSKLAGKLIYAYKKALHSHSLL